MIIAAYLCIGMILFDIGVHLGVSGGDISTNELPSNLFAQILTVCLVALIWPYFIVQSIMDMDIRG